MTSISGSLLSNMTQDTQAQRELAKRVENLKNKLGGEEPESVSAPTELDKVTLSQEAIMKSQDLSDYYEVPELKEPIVHKTDKGNEFTFTTEKKVGGGNQLIVTIKDKSGQQTRHKIDKETIISEDADGNLTFRDIQNGGTDGNDIVIDFLNGRNGSVSTKGGDDFVLSLGNDIVNSADEVFEKDGQTFMVKRDSNGQIIGSYRFDTSSTEIDTGEGDDIVRLIGESSEKFTVRTGAGDDTVIGEQLNSEKGAHGLSVDITTGDGNDSVTLDAMDKGRVDTGDGDDTVDVKAVYGDKDNNGVDGGVITTGSGNDKVNIEEVYYGFVETGDGDDEVTVDKLLGDTDGFATSSGVVDTGKGDDSITVNNMNHGTVKAGLGNDALSFKNVENSEIDAGNGDDELKFGTMKNTTVQTGSGANKVTVSGKMEDTTFNAVGGEVKFLFSALATSENVKFLNLSKSTAANLLPFLRSVDLDVSIGSGDYAISIGVNTDEGNKFNNGEDEPYLALINEIYTDERDKEAQSALLPDTEKVDTYV